MRPSAAWLLTSILVLASCDADKAQPEEPAVRGASGADASVSASAEAEATPSATTNAAAAPATATATSAAATAKADEGPGAATFAKKYAEDESEKVKAAAKKILEAESK
jgi:hypothetical protein